ncbi:hypothetical protein BGW38_001490 [Lunasporangiospora selenospora]|uniref:Transmembrane protein n=1 Tax=Lunasporangiospora selenospora TaxID=979761 RepID=A0A9P6FU03_9FUNG|nr:hypothetical protein BGW38_001490 [Lunasporangiospora selenospora]
MSSTLPNLGAPCISTIDTTRAYLAGYYSGSLTVLNVDYSDVSNPSASTVYSSLNSTWSPSLSKACMSFPPVDTYTGPLWVQQFGGGSPVMEVFGNMTGIGPMQWVELQDFRTSKLFAQVASNGVNRWYAAMTSTTYSITQSPWTGVRFSGNVYENFHKSALLAVGAYSTNSAATGYLVVFDTTRSGQVYQANGNSGTAPVTLLSTQNVDMNGIVLSNDAIPVSAENIAYILDKGTDGRVTIYSINPALSLKLQRVSFTGDAPQFQSSLVATTTSSDILIYYIHPTYSAVLSRFSAQAGTWAGNGLVKGTSPSPSPSPTTPPNPNPGSTNLGAIIGGVVGGLVLIALLVFLFIRYRRKVPTKDRDNVTHPNNSPEGKPMITQGHLPPQSPPAMTQIHTTMPQQQQQHYIPQQQYALQQQQQFPPQQPVYATNNGFMSQQQQQQQPVYVSQGQEQFYAPLAPTPYVYVPPTVIPPEQQYLLQQQQQQQQQQQDQITMSPQIMPVVYQPPPVGSPASMSSPGATTLYASGSPMQTPASQSASLPKISPGHTPATQEDYLTKFNVPAPVPPPRPSNPQYFGDTPSVAVSSGHSPQTLLE